jgi:hypothetical protein
MSKTRTYSAVQFSGYRIAAVQVAHSNGEFELTSLYEEEGSINYSEAFSTPPSPPDVFIQTLEQDMRLLRKRADIDAENLSVSLSSSFVFLHAFPLDESLSPDDRSEQLRWELSNYLEPAGAENYITGTARLAEPPVSGISLILSATVKKELVTLFRQVCSRLGLSLTVVEVDHFGAEDALLWNYPELEKTTAALLGFKRDRIDGSLIARRQPVSFRWMALENGAYGSDFLERCFPRTMNGMPAIERVFVYGEENEVLDALSSIGRRTAVETLNPIRRIQVTRRLRTLRGENLHRFAPLIGVAMRES